MSIPNDYRPALIEYVGVDGSTWVLSGPGMGEQGVELALKPKGMYGAPVKTIWRSGANQDGGTYEGQRHPARDIQWAIHLFGVDGYDLEDVYGRWSRAWSTSKTGTIRYTTPSGVTRTIAVQLVEMINTEPDRDPRLTGYVKLALDIRAPRPWYQSEPARDAWRFDGINFVGHVTVSNPTDRPSALRWSLKSPARFILPDYSWVEGDEHENRMVRMPFQKLGQDVAIDTQEGEPTAVCPGYPNYWALLGGQDFLYTVPPGTPPTTIPIYVDPLPTIPFNLPIEWSMWLAEKVTEQINQLPDTTVFTTTPEQMAEWIADAVREVTPDWLEDLSPDIIGEMIPSTIAGWITQAFGSLGNMAGAAAMVEMPREWDGPWGLSEEAYW